MKKVVLAVAAVMAAVVLGGRRSLAVGSTGCEGISARGRGDH